MRLILAATLCPLCFAGVVDRIAIVIDKQVITESEIVSSLRLTDFLNNQPLDLGSAARRTEGEHMVDQELIRRELEASGFAGPAASQADALLRSFRQQRFPSLAGYRDALAKYGITEDELKARLLWQLTAILFTDFRFGSILSDNAAQSADGSADGSSSQTVDQRLDAWLKQARADTKVTFKPEAFQ
jgi:hypothetical protein